MEEISKEELIEELSHACSIATKIKVENMAFSKANEYLEELRQKVEGKDSMSAIGCVTTLVIFVVCVLLFGIIGGMLVAVVVGAIIQAIVKRKSKMKRAINKDETKIYEEEYKAGKADFERSKEEHRKRIEEWEDDAIYQKYQSYTKDINGFSVAYGMLEALKSGRANTFEEALQYGEEYCRRGGKM